MRIISPPSNDDHPPSDVSLGQALVLKVYDALASSPNWAKTMLVITYDEHGGFFDHVPPPLNPPDDDPTGVRPLRRPRPGDRRLTTGRQAQLLARALRPHLDHQDDPAPLRPHRNTIPDMGKRVTNAQHLGALLTEPKPRPAETPELYRPLADKIDANRQDATHQQLTLGANARAAAKPSQPTSNTTTSPSKPPS